MKFTTTGYFMYITGRVDNVLRSVTWEDGQLTGDNAIIINILAFLKACEDTGTFLGESDGDGAFENHINNWVAMVDCMHYIFAPGYVFSDVDLPQRQTGGFSYGN